MVCLVAYDIENNRIRSKLARYLEGKGVRIQKSVFVVEIERHSIKRFMNKLLTFSEGNGKESKSDKAGKGGKIAVFRLCTGCQKNAVQIADQEKEFYIF